MTIYIGWTKSIEKSIVSYYVSIVYFGGVAKYIVYGNTFS